MGKYDGPHFFAEDESIVSVWAATVAFDDIPDDYWIYNRDGNDDTPFNRFSSDFGFGYYDDDFVDTNADAVRRIVPIGQLILPCSYGASFADAVGRRAEQLGVASTSYVFLMYNFRYDPSVTGVDRSSCLQFLGVFDYEEGE